MTFNAMSLMQGIVWPLVLLVAWMLADVLYARWQVPRITSYAAVGMVAGAVHLPGWTDEIVGLPFVATAALSLALFELGYRINLRWFAANPWLLVTAVLGSGLTFVAVWLLTGWWTEWDAHVRLAVSALAMATSPAGTLRVVHELRSAGQVTERVMHLTAVSCLLSVLTLNAVMGSHAREVSGDLGKAITGSLVVLVTSVVVGGGMGVLLPRLLRGRLAVSAEGATVAFVLAVIFLTTAANGLKLSPVLAALTFGVVARERRYYLMHNVSNFGSAGDLLGVFLFVYIAAVLDWADIVPGLAMGAVLVLVRATALVAVNMATAHVSGITQRKGLLTGLALSPMSSFVVLLAAQTGQAGFELADQTLTAMAGMVTWLMLLGPVVAQRALVASRETHVSHDS